MFESVEQKRVYHKKSFEFYFIKWDVSDFNNVYGN